ncbi:MAG: hypothetical protein QOJ89_3456 [bacterium]
MADRYVVLLRMSDEQREDVRNKSITDFLGRQLERNGGRLLSLYLTAGSYDGVAIFELDSALIIAFAQSMPRWIGECTILRALEEEEADLAARDWVEPETAPKLGP